MKKLTAIIILALSALPAYASIEHSIEHYIRKRAVELHKIDRDQYTYQGEVVATVRSELVGDHHSDAAVLIEFCEEYDCHLTTHSYDLLILQGKGNNQYQRWKSIPLDLISNAAIKVNGNKIIVTGTKFKDTDPHCCPSKKVTYVFRVDNTGLKKIH